MSDRSARTPSVVLAVASHDSLSLRFFGLTSLSFIEVYLFCTILSEVSNKCFSAKGDYVLDPIVPSVFV